VSLSLKIKNEWDIVIISNKNVIIIDELIFGFIVKEIEMSAKVITKENFEAEAVKSDQPVLLDFWAPWCGPCKMLMPVIDELAEEVTHAKVFKVNVDDEPELASKFRVMSVPTLVVMKDGKVVDTTVGIKSKDTLLEMLNV
jgi:thioredoxin 1